MDSKIVISNENLFYKSIDDPITSDLVLLSIMKYYTMLNMYNDHCVLKINKGLYDYLLKYFRDNINIKIPKNEEKKLANIFFIFAFFSNPRNNTVAITEHDIAKILGVSIRTIQRYIARYQNNIFNVNRADNIASLLNKQEGKDVHIKPNKYELLLGRVFKDYKSLPKFSIKDSKIQIKIDYKGLCILFKLNLLFNRYKGCQIPCTIKNNERQNFRQLADTQCVECKNFEHFKNPIYESGFDVENTQYPKNWCRHPSPNAYFKKGRWYGGVIHGTMRGKHRDGYLDYIGLTHEIDMHTAMFYFLISLLPDSITPEDKAAYYETAKNGTLYDDLIEDVSIRLEQSYDEENNLLSIEVIKAAFLPNRDIVKQDFQRYRNLKGKTKGRVQDVAVFVNEKFPTIHQWMLDNKEVLQNKLAWIETDFISCVGEKLTAENIQFDWLHDAVYVSEENSKRAQEIWDSVRDEFESVFV